VPQVPELTRAAPLRRVGHKGADLIAPGNTRESFDAALGAGVDMIEFDVLPEDHMHRDTTRLLLAHDYEHDLRDAMTLQEGVAHLASDAFGEVELDVDLKLPGYEQRVVAVLQEHDLVQRAIVSSQYMRSLVRIRELEPGLRLGWSVPRAKRDRTTSKLWLPLALTVLAVWKRRLPRLAAGHIGERRIDAVMAHWRLVTPQLVRTIHDAGGELYVWTVDDAAKIRQLEAMGVDAVITNDPRLFASPR
jgi:glycerophosphoryl diester phosphodiesterase